MLMLLLLQGRMQKHNQTPKSSPIRFRANDGSKNLSSVEQTPKRMEKWGLGIITKTYSN
ncbi:hypothetical protein Hanom_Chr16g01510011 [Helianthus anomalus]